jgi:hypothetical protein
MPGRFVPNEETETELERPTTFRDNGINAIKPYFSTASLFLVSAVFDNKPHTWLTHKLGTTVEDVL